MVAKSPDLEALERWRGASLVLNSARRFRYTANIQKRLKSLNSLHQFHVGGLALEAIRRFQASLPDTYAASIRIAKEEGFEVSPRELEHIVEKGDMEELDSFGGVEGLMEVLKTSSSGLEWSGEEERKRHKVFGTNIHPEKPAKSFLSFLWDAAQDVTLMILAVCAVISVLVGIPTEGLAEGWYDGAGIGFSIILVVFVTAISDYQQSLQFRQLDAEKKKIYIEVSRNNKRQKVLTSDLLVGDIVFLSIGDIVPSDGIFIQGYSVLINESSMTGESEPQHRDHNRPFLQAGTQVQDGGCTMLVTGVGMRTQWGRLMSTLNEDEDEETPLQVRLSGVATLVGNLGLIVATLVLIILILRFFISVGFTWKGAYLLQLVNFFAIAVTIIVVAVPEGLPLAVTLTLAFAMKKMMADKALVRKLAACETMGSATTICSDKTGTLTTNKMTVVRAWLGGKVLDMQAGRKEEIAPRLYSLLLENVYQNTSGDVGEDNNVIASPTEAAILNMATNLGGDFRTVRGESTIMIVDPFNSKRKRMGVIVRLPNGRYRAHWKGAAEMILSMCDKMMGPNGEVYAMEQGTLGGVINAFAEDALRTLSLAYKDLSPREVPNGPFPDDFAIPDSNFTLLTIVGIKDPLRSTVTASVKLCQSAGIMVRMVTGDNITTAKAIARECGILTDGEAIEGPVFRNLDPAQIKALLPRLQVMARSSPEDKHTLVRELRAMGEVVAVTGDGTNDAPALKLSDIGLAMGIAGTEVAKESADIVILDDNFATIVQVAKWGRSVYNNIQKFVQFQLTVNIVALVINFVSACITGEAPLTAVQLLWVNLIMDTLGALALATEPPDDSLMLKPPIGRKGRLISTIMWRNIAGQAIYQLLVLGILQYKGIQLLAYSGPQAEIRLNTMIFNAFVFCQVFNEFNARHMERINVLKNLLGNTLFIAVITVTVVFQVVLVQFLGKFASTVPLDLKEWGICVAIGFLSMPIAVVVKFIPVPSYESLSSKSEPENGYEALDGNDSTLK